jgi:hypothetical protein
MLGRDPEIESSSAGAPGRSWLVKSELVVLTIGMVSGATIPELSLLLFGLRAGLTGGALLNEWGHLGVALCLRARGPVLTAQNLLGHRSVRQHAMALVPLCAFPSDDLKVRFSRLDPEQAEAIRRNGFWWGCVALIALFACVGFGTNAVSTLLLVAFAGALLSTAGGVGTDLRPSSPFAGSLEWMGCGNVTVMGRLASTERAALPVRIGHLIERMLSVSQIRGSQSGGGAIQIRSHGIPRQKITKKVNPKRGNLASRMTAAIARTARSAEAYGQSFLVQTHVRFATSGVSTEHETHPFRYVDSAERGLRRVTTWQGDKVVVHERPVETAITHNGDMDGLNWRGRKMYYPDLSVFLEKVVGYPNRWVGDSPLLAAALELFLCRGLWLESFRLAYHVTVAPPLPELGEVPPELSGPERRLALQRLLSDYPTLDQRLLLRWQEIAERVTAELSGACAAAGGEDRLLAQEARETWLTRLLDHSSDFALIPEARRRGFLTAAVNAFFDNDLYVAVRKLEPALLGTFGCVVSSTLEPNTVVALSRGQPLSIGFRSDDALIGLVSERAALKVLQDDGEGAFDSRLDLDLCRGEIARVALLEGGPPQVTLYSISSAKELDQKELTEHGRFLSLRGNPYVSALPVPERDRIEQDRAQLPHLLVELAASFANRDSYNHKTFEAFFEALFHRVRPNLLLVGITNDLWLAEQFVKSFKLLFPKIPAVAMSSNQVLLQPELVPVDADTVVLAVSQSGQDFPTMGAFLTIGQKLGPRSDESLFMLTGEVDCLMGMAVGQKYSREAAFSNRIFVNQSGFRPTEAAIGTVAATHHCLSEILLGLARRATDPERFPSPPYGCTLRAKDVHALEEHARSVRESHVPLLTAHGDAGQSPALQKQVVRYARRWYFHVVEGALGFLFLLLVLELNLQFDLGVLPSSLLRAGTSLASLPSWLEKVLQVLGSQLDVAFYALLIPLFVWTLRLLQRREVFHRQGVRELLIADTGYVHRLAWHFARKLFSLSYGFASIKPYSADCQDEMIVTHEPVRGSLLLIGLPDSRRKGLRTRSAAALMAAKQFGSSRSFATSGAEVVTIGHAPPSPGSAFAGHIQLPSAPIGERGAALLDELREGLYDSWERLLAMQVFLDELAHAVASLRPASYDRTRTKDQVFAPTTAAPVSAAEIYQVLSRASERLAQHGHLSLPFDLRSSSWKSGADSVRTSYWPATGSDPHE